MKDKQIQSFLLAELACFVGGVISLICEFFLPAMILFLLSFLLSLVLPILLLIMLIEK